MSAEHSARPALQIVGTSDATADVSSQPEGRKYDAGKPRPDLIPAGPLLEVSKVLAYGAAKYTKGASSGENNWQHVEGGRQRYHAAALRHVLQWQSGERHDSETGLHHLAHAACCLLFVLWFELRDGGKP